MKEEIIALFEELFSAFASIYSLNQSKVTYKQRKKFISELKEKDADVCAALEKLITDYESYFFTKTDKELRFKAPDIYDMEMDRIKQDIIESKSNLKSFFEDEYIIGLINKV